MQPQLGEYLVPAPRAVPHSLINFSHPMPCRPGILGSRARQAPCVILAIHQGPGPGCQDFLDL